MREFATNSRVSRLRIAAGRVGLSILLVSENQWADQKNGSTCTAIASAFETSEAPALSTDKTV